MGNKVKIMGMELDILSEDALRKEFEGFLSYDFLNVIHLISLDYMDAFEENEQIQETLGEADLVLPGEQAILSSSHVDVLATGGMVVDYRIAGKACGKEMLTGRTCYLVLRDRKEARIIYRYLASHHPALQVVGLYTSDSGVTDEALVNDINTGLPDLIFMSMESPHAEAWLHDNRAKINAKLCVVLGSVMDMIIRENIHIPHYLKRLHLGKIYTHVARIPYSNMWRRRIFRKKMDNYNSRKLMEIADVIEELSDEGENKRQ